MSKTTTTIWKSTGLLKAVLQTNAITSALSGAIFTIASARIGEFIGLNESLIPTGLFLILFAAAVMWTARQQPINLKVAWAIITLDLAWVAGSVVMMLSGGLNTVGTWVVGLMADAVLLFAIGQIIGVRRLQRQSVDERLARS